MSLFEPDREALLALYAEHHDPPDEIVSKLPKGKEDKSKRASCRTCGGYHDPSMFHLDYVGHADVTRVLIEQDPLWNWEPLATTAEGLPLFDRDNQGQPVGLWIRLTLHGKTMLGYGSCEASKADGEKELIGDALRNAGMRFGIALDLWSKADQTGDGGNRSTAPARTERPAGTDLAEVDAAIVDAMAAGLEVDAKAVRAHAQQGPAYAEQATRLLHKRIEEAAAPPDICDICGKPEDGHTHDEVSQDTQEGGQATTETDPEGDATAEGGDGASGHDAGRAAPEPAPRDTGDGGSPADSGDTSNDQEDADDARAVTPPAGDAPQGAASPAPNSCKTCGPDPRTQPCPDCPSDDDGELPWQRADRLEISAADQMLKVRELAGPLKATIPARRHYVGTGKCHPDLTAAFVAWLDEVEEGLAQKVGA